MSGEQFVLDIVVANGVTPSLEMATAALDDADKLPLEQARDGTERPIPGYPGCTWKLVRRVEGAS